MELKKVNDLSFSILWSQMINMKGWCTMPGKKMDIDRVRISTSVEPLFLGYSKVMSAYLGIKINVFIEVAINEYLDFFQKQYKGARQEILRYVTKRRSGSGAPFTTNLDRQTLGNARELAREIKIPLNVLLELCIRRYMITHKDIDPFTHYLDVPGELR